jgi:hypothetical protein
VSRLIYIGTRLSNAPVVGTILEALGPRWSLSYDWRQHGDGLAGELAAGVAGAEIAGVVRAHVFGLVLPGGRGAHAELGAALATDKPVVLWRMGEPDCLFYLHRRVTEVHSLNEFVTVSNLLWEEWAGRAW